ncbi:acyl-CoA thioesterase [Marinigracilibium pacificum]|uniref:Acyl-CoA thioesterase n=1 Tax=Marinigracilibium pacificum TaxID=2729599 RepID=A0A848IVZ9_9BACT|nr:acyl-CoA thioesterase [Marinigracilibium pacificum]NMM47866.1 acyl-CoA thioesterase [Marinigracilibium pacificum]
MKDLIVDHEINIRFSEVDSMGVVWHGNHVKYFEDGREAFGKKFGLEYMSVYRKGYFMPIVSINCDYKQPITYEQTIIVRTKYIPHRASKIIFEYTLISKKTGDVLAIGQTTQVFIDQNRDLQLITPPFFEDWKAKNGIVH